MEELKRNNTSESADIDYPSADSITLNVKLKLKTYRLFFNLKQLDISHIVHKSISTVTAWERLDYDAERGPIIKPNYRDLVILRDLYNIPLDQIFSWKNRIDDKEPSLNQYMFEHPESTASYLSNEEIATNVKIRLKTYRINANISQHQLSTEVHKSISTITSWERLESEKSKGPVIKPDYRDLIYLCNRYGITLEELFRN